MEFPALMILGYSEAAMFLRATPAPDVGAIISIHGRREFGVDEQVTHRLDLEFDDVAVPDAADIASVQRERNRHRRELEYGLAQTPPCAADVAAIIRFAADIKEMRGGLLCHCGGGISRAPAAALICLAVWHGAGTEAVNTAQVREIRRGAMPHVGMVRWADEMLGRDGRLVRAVEEER